MSQPPRYRAQRAISAAAAAAAVLFLHAPAAAVPYVATTTPPAVAKSHPLLEPVAVFGGDERAPVPQAMRSISSKIGVIHDRRSQSVCTVFCVAPDVVATAAHCLYRTAEE